MNDQFTSSVARHMWLFVVYWVIPSIVPRASERQWGANSPLNLKYIFIDSFLFILYKNNQQKATRIIIHKNTYVNFCIFQMEDRFDMARSSYNPYAGTKYTPPVSFTLFAMSSDSLALCNKPIVFSHLTASPAVAMEPLKWI